MISASQGHGLRPANCIETAGREEGAGLKKMRWKPKKRRVMKKMMSLIKLTLRRQAFTLYPAPKTHS